MKTYFSRPYHLVVEPKKSLLTAVRISLFIFLFLYFFQPFELSEDPNKMILVLGYAGISFIIILIFLILIPRLFPSFFTENDWTVGKELSFKLSLIGGIGLMNTIYTMKINLLDSFWSSFLYFEVCTFAVAIFPLLYLVYKMERYDNSKFHKLSEKITRESCSTGKKAVIEQVNLFTYKQEVALRLSSDSVYYIKSSSNYIEVIFKEHAVMKKQLIRNTLTNTEYQLQAFPVFFRCHKSYLINLTKIKRVSGNARGLRLHFFDLEDTVPVSRKSNHVLSKRLKLYAPLAE
ncbi:MAG: LytTR family DNA-binding domain-containing protein [Bacteroidota bacterium]